MLTRAEIQIVEQGEPLGMAQGDLRLDQPLFGPQRLNRVITTKGSILWGQLIRLGIHRLHRDIRLIQKVMPIDLYHSQETVMSHLARFSKIKVMPYLR